MTRTTMIAGLMAALLGTAAIAQMATDPTTSDEAAIADAGPMDGPLDGFPGGMGFGPGGRGPGGFDIATFDADGDGIVTEDEVAAEAEARFAAADTDGNGGLSAEEMVAAREAARLEQMTARSEAAVERMDDDGDGLLQAAEIEARAPRLAPLFDRLDADGDGGISQAEVDAARAQMGPDGGGRGRGPGGRHGHDGPDPRG